MKRRGLRLGSKQRDELMELRDHDPRPFVRERCGALLKVADGQSAHAVARDGLLRRRLPDTLYFWLDLYEAQGAQGVVTHSHGGARRRRF